MSGLGHFSFRRHGKHKQAVRLVSIGFVARVISLYLSRCCFYLYLGDTSLGEPQCFDQLEATALALHSGKNLKQQPRGPMTRRTPLLRLLEIVATPTPSKHKKAPSDSPREISYFPQPPKLQHVRPPNTSQTTWLSPRSFSKLHRLSSAQVSRKAVPEAGRGRLQGTRADRGPHVLGHADLAGEKKQCQTILSIKWMQRREARWKKGIAGISPR